MGMVWKPLKLLPYWIYHFVSDLITRDYRSYCLRFGNYWIYHFVTDLITRDYRSYFLRFGDYWIYHFVTDLLTRDYWIYHCDSDNTYTLCRATSRSMRTSSLRVPWKAPALTSGRWSTAGSVVSSS